MKRIRIGKRTLSETSRPFIVADVGVNHENDVNLAKRMIREAAYGGADAVKFQTYKAERIAARNSPPYWATGESQYEYFQKYDRFSEEDYLELAEYARGRNVIFMSTPFDFEAADFLDELVPAFKISSSDITNIPFIRHVAAKNKPVFLSTGASTIAEISEAVTAIEEEGNNQLVILHCVLSYPTKYEDANLNMILHLKRTFPDFLVGLSDHTLPDENMLVLTVGALLGAKVIEKHFTFDKSLEGNDHYHSMDLNDLKKLVRNLGLCRKILGKTRKKPLETEGPARKYARRSIVAKTGIPKGTKITEDMLDFKRPGTGISPQFLEILIGRTARKKVEQDEIIKWEHV